MPPASDRQGGAAAVVPSLLSVTDASCATPTYADRQEDIPTCGWVQQASLESLPPRPPPEAARRFGVSPLAGDRGNSSGPGDGLEDHGCRPCSSAAIQHAGGTSPRPLVRSVVCRPRARG